MTLRLTDRKPYEKELDCYTENAIKTYIYTDGHWTALQSRTEGTTQNVTEHTVMTDREVQETCHSNIHSERHPKEHTENVLRVQDTHKETHTNKYKEGYTGRRRMTPTGT